MLEATFTFTADDALAQRILFHVNEMSGVTAALSGPPYALTARIASPFDAARLNDVENVIRGLAPNVVRA